MWGHGLATGLTRASGTRLSQVHWIALVERRSSKPQSAELEIISNAHAENYLWSMVAVFALIKENGV